MKKLLLIFLMLGLLTGAVYANMEAYQAAKKDFKYIEHSSKVSRKSYKIVADKFYKIYSKNPRGSLGDDSLHYTAQTYYRSYVRYKSRSDLLNALKYLKILASNYNSRLASLAYIQSSKLYEQQKDYPSARYMLNKQIARFPNTEDSKVAKQRLRAIEKKFNNSLYSDFGGEDTASKKKPSPKPKKPVVKPAVTDIKDDTADTADAYDYKKDTRGKVFGSIDKKIAVPAGKVLVQRLKYYPDEDYTRIVLNTSSKPKYDKHWLKADPSINKPPRLFLDVYNAVVSKDIPRDVKVKDGLLRAVRWGYNRPGVARVVLDADNVQDFTIFAMSNPDRLVIDVSGKPMKKRPNTQVASSGKKSNLSAYKSQTKKVPQGTKVKNGKIDGNTLASAFGLKINTIVIDPGHGGSDPGSVHNRVKEKDVVLDVGKELYRLIKRDLPDIKVYMTRNKDVFIPLESRTAFANRKKADVFLSIHANGARNRRARGVETYVLNVTNDKHALEVAALENKATQKSMSDLQGILHDIMLNSKLEESLQLASFIQDNLFRGLYRSRQYNRGVKQAPFFVLTGAKMPSILVEVGFVSNKNEAKMLRTKKYRKRIAQSIHKGLKDYVKIFNGK